MDDVMKNVALFIATALIIGLVISTAFFATDKPATAHVKVVPKIGTLSSQTRVINFFTKGAKKMEKFSNVIWVGKDGTEIIESDAKAYLGVKKSQQTQFFKFMEQKGFTRYRKTCKNMASYDHTWSMGYCYNELIGKKA